MSRFFAACFFSVAIVSTCDASPIKKIHLRCNNQQEADAADEIYLVVKVDGKEIKGFGKDEVYSMSRDSTKTIEKEIPYSTDVTIAVWEKDRTSNDLLGTVTITKEPGDESLTGGKNLGKWDYDVSWE